MKNRVAELDARCRLLAAELGAAGYVTEHAELLGVAEGLQVQAQGYMPPMPTDLPYQTLELADVGTDDNPRPGEDEIFGRQPTPGSRLDPTRGVPMESDVRKWVVQISDIPAQDEEDLKGMVTPFVDEVGGLLSDYKEESPRTKTRKTD